MNTPATLALIDARPDVAEEHVALHEVGFISTEELEMLSERALAAIANGEEPRRYSLLDA